MDKPEPSSQWSLAYTGMYALTDAELGEIIRMIREAEEQRGIWLTPEALRLALRKPGA